MRLLMYIPLLALAADLFDKLWDRYATNLNEYDLLPDHWFVYGTVTRRGESWKYFSMRTFSYSYAYHVVSDECAWSRAYVGYWKGWKVYWKPV